jgi:acyl-CoA synthetase (AMP-forming)/AMP-acid ligase II
VGKADVYWCTAACVTVCCCLPGTTGLPKAVVHTHENVCAHTWATAQALGLNSRGEAATSAAAAAVLPDEYAASSSAARTSAGASAVALSSSKQHTWGHFGPMFHVGDVAFVWVGALSGAKHVFHPAQAQIMEVLQLISEVRVYGLGFRVSNHGGAAAHLLR